MGEDDRLRLQIEIAERAVERLRGVDEVIYGRLTADVTAWAVKQRVRLNDSRGSASSKST